MYKLVLLFLLIFSNFSLANVSNFDREFSKGTSFCQGYHPSPKPLVNFDFEARKKGDSLFDRSVVSSQDLHRLWKLSYYFNITSSETCLLVWKKYMEAWVDTYKSNGNPIDEDVIEVLILSYAITREKLNFDSVVKYDSFLMNIFLRNFEISNSRSYGNFNRESAIWNNNWESIRLKNMMLIAYALGNESLVSIVIPKFFQHFHFNLGDGYGLYDFFHRDSINYAAYSANAILISYLFAVKLGRVEFAREYSSILKRVYYNFHGYVSGDKDRLEFLNSRERQDGYKLTMAKKSDFFYAKNYVCLYDFIWGRQERLVEIGCQLPLHIRQFFQLYELPALDVM